MSTHALGLSHPVGSVGQPQVPTVTTAARSWSSDLWRAVAAAALVAVVVILVLAVVVLIGQGHGVLNLHVPGERLFPSVRLLASPAHPGA